MEELFSIQFWRFRIHSLLLLTSDVALPESISDFGGHSRGLRSICRTSSIRNWVKYTGSLLSLLRDRERTYNNMVNWDICSIPDEITRRWISWPGRVGSALILLWLISRVSSRGISVNLVLVRPNSPPKKHEVHTTSGNVEKELCLRFKYLSRERYINSSGKVVSWLLPRASLHGVRNMFIC